MRVVNAGNLLVSLDKSEGVSISLSYVDSAVISLGEDIRFFRGIELEFTLPQTYLPHRGSLALVLYGDLDRMPQPGVADLSARQLYIEPIPNKLQVIYQIPIRQGHGLRPSPYVTLPLGIVEPKTFPLLFRVMPVDKGLGEEVESMRFQLSVKPIFSDEGAVRVSLRYPEQLPGRPVTVLIDDEVAEKPQEEKLLKEGEHQLVIISNDYRNENRRFLIERGKTLDLAIALQDVTPLVFFEAPENTRIFFDNEAVDGGAQGLAVEPGLHEVRFQMSDYSVVKPVTIQRGKTYRLALAVDVSVSESE
ncbi:hypothetical protein AGMMS49942_04390 [Spirochaetia bacterium]|nr:hypothetical protein AGMMS49942_04390 [Spirochaetia bacterium]